jgi:hypothetical protein
MPKDTPQMGDNSQSRYEQCKTDLGRLEEIKAEKKALSDEAGTIIKRLEKDGGVNRGALAEVRKMLDLSPAAIQAREESRSELMEWLIAPKLAEAAQGRTDE